jgi:hypothetical protein
MRWRKAVRRGHRLCHNTLHFKSREQGAFVL